MIERVSDWVPLKEGDQFWEKGQLVKASAGDLILFDSRTIHGGRVGTGEYPKEVKNGKSNNPITLARLTLTVCMCEKDRIKDNNVIK